MKHLRNSTNDTVYLLEHHGKPTVLTTDFGETITKGSLCIDLTSQDLYILRNTTWVLVGTSSTSTGDFIPLAGTSTTPVFGDIEFEEDMSLYSGRSKITIGDTTLDVRYDTNILSLNDNLIFHKDDTTINVDTNSLNNIILKSNINLILTDSSENIINSIIDNISLNNVNYSSVSGKIRGITSLDSIVYSNLSLVSDNNLMLSDITKTHIYGSIVSNNFSFQTVNNSFIHSNIFDITNFTNVDKAYITGSLKLAELSDITNISYIGDLDNIGVSNSKYIYSIGHMTSEPTADLEYSESYKSNISDIEGLFNLGALGAVDVTTGSNYNTFIGRNLFSSIINSKQNTYINTNKADSTNSNQNYFFNIDSGDMITGIVNSHYNLFHNSGISATNSRRNIIYNAYSLDITGNNNFLFGNEFEGIINGNNNFLLSIPPAKYWEFKNNIFTFGNITGDDDLVLDDGNIIIGNVNINDTLTTNNQIYGAKPLSNIDHNLQTNNIFLNVDNFIVPDEDTVYLPEKFYGINSVGKFGKFNLANISNNQTWDFPNKSGTVALLDDIIPASSSGGAGANVIDSDYISLYSLKNSNTLEVGAFYKIDIQTKHIITYTTNLNTGTTETILILAVATNKFHHQVYSVQYPTDIIHYDIDSSLCEDNITSRTGKITYRKDTINNKETYYDFRTVKFRRYLPDLPRHTWTGLNGANPINHKFGEVIINSDISGKQTVYILANEYTSTSNIFTNYSRNYQPVMRLDSDVYERAYCMWKDTIQLTEDNTINGGGDGKLYAATSYVANTAPLNLLTSTVYKDYLTFNDITNNNIENISIGKSNTYNNIVFISSGGTYASNSVQNSVCKDIHIADNCKDMSIYTRLFYDIKIGTDVSDLYVSRDSNNVVVKSNSKNISFFNGITNASIGYDNQYIIINNVYNLNIGNYCSAVYINEFYNENINIGHNNYRTFIDGSYNTDIYIGDGYVDNNIKEFDSSFQTSSLDNVGDYFYDINGSGSTNSKGFGSEQIKILGGYNQNITVGKNCYDIIIGDLANGKSSNITIGDLSNNVKLLWGGSINVNIGKSCDTVIISDLSNPIFNVSVGDNSKIITIDNVKNCYIGCDNESIIVKASNTTTIGNNNKTITIFNSNNTSIGNVCSDILIPVTTLSCNKNVFGDFCKNISINRNNISNNIFSENTSFITINGITNYNRFNGCNNITIGSTSTVNYCIFSISSNQLAFNTGTLNYVQFTAFNNTLKTCTSSLSNSIVNMRSVDDNLWYQSIDNFGAIITNQFL